MKLESFSRLNELRFYTKIFFFIALQHKMKINRISNIYIYIYVCVCLYMYNADDFHYSEFEKILLRKHILYTFDNVLRQGTGRRCFTGNIN